MTLAELARAAGGRLLSGDPAAPVKGFFVDSRAVVPGGLFVALKGARSDGHDFVRDVLSRGAGGAVVTRPVPGAPAGAALVQVPDAVRALKEAARARRAASAARVVGITGSNGKTTTKEMVAQVLSAGGKNVYSTAGNHNSQIGLPLTVWGLEPAHTHAVFEMGASEKGNIADLCEVARPQIGVITNIGRAHLETFGSLEGVAEAKWELAAFLPPDGLAVLNADDERLMSRRGRARARVCTFGFAAGADVRAEDLRQAPQTSFTLAAPAGRAAVRLPVPGLFNARNALAAAAVAFGEGLSLDQVVRGLESFRPPAQRMQERRGRNGALFLVDAYNANPDSMRASLESFAAAYPGRRRVAVLGGMRELGPAAVEEHRALGRLAGSLDLAKVFFLGEEGAWVSEGWPAPAADRLVLAVDKDALRDMLSREAAAGAVFLFKASRGVKMEEVYEPLIES